MYYCLCLAQSVVSVKKMSSLRRKQVNDNFIVCEEPLWCWQNRPRSKMVRQRCSSILSSTSAPDVDRWSTPRPGRFTIGMETRYPSYMRLSGSQGRCGRVLKTQPSPAFDSRTVQPIASRFCNTYDPTIQFIHQTFAVSSSLNCDVSVLRIHQALMFKELKFYRTRRDRLWAHPAFCTIGTVSVSREETSRGVTLTIHYHPAQRLRKGQIYTSPSPLGLRGLFQGELYLLITLYLVFTFNIYVYPYVGRTQQGPKVSGLTNFLR